LFDGDVPARDLGERGDAVIGETACDDPAEPRKLRVAVQREPMQAHPRAHQTHADRADLVLAEPDARLDVGTGGESHADPVRGVNDRALDVAQVRRSIWAGADVYDRIADQLAGPVEREGSAPIDEVNRRAARGQDV